MSLTHLEIFHQSEILTDKKQKEINME